MNDYLFFSAKWCAKCKAVWPRVSEKLGDKVTKYDVDESPELVSEYGIQTLPTMIGPNGERFDSIRIDSFLG